MDPLRDSAPRASEAPTARPASAASAAGAPVQGTPFGKFVLVTRLGSGGFGEVWKAWDGAIGRWVALKLLKGHDPEEIARFAREARAAAALAHDQIAVVYEVGVESDRPFIAMQLVEGSTLRHARPRDPRTVVAWMRDAALAVAFAHDHGIVHRDLKPDNLMVDGAGRVYVMDFGLAKLTSVESSLSRSGFCIGTPAYMSPEQARGDVRDVDARSDIWSLGATLHELLDGSPPFAGAGLDVLLHVVTDEPAPLPSVDRDLRTIVATCLRKEPARRYATARDLASDLDAWLRHESIRARPPGLPARLARQKGALIVAAGVVALVAALFLVRPLLGSREDKIAEARRQLLDRMRRTSDDCLQAALDQRRAGRLDGLPRLLDDVTGACRAVSAAEPALAEPHLRLGRLLRALMRFDDALAEQELALARDPADAGARFERGLLRIRAYERRIAAARRVWRQGQADAVGTLGLESPAPSRDELEDAESRTLRLRALGDLDGLSQPVARALSAWLRGDAEARALFELAVEKNPEVEEAWEWLARLRNDDADLDGAIETASKAHELDRGYLPHLEIRALARLNRSNVLSRRGEDPVPLLAGAVADADEVLRLEPGRVDALVARAQARTNWGCHLGDSGGDPQPAWRRALEDADAAVSPAPARADALLTRAVLRSNWGAWSARRGEDPVAFYRAAMEDTEAARRLSPDRLEPLLRLAAAAATLAGHLLDRGEPHGALTTEALDRLEEVLARSPGHLEALLRRGLLHEAAARSGLTSGTDPAPGYRNAQADFDEALRLRPSWHQARHARARFRVNVGLWIGRGGGDPAVWFEGALADFDEAARGLSASAEFWSNRAAASSLWGNHELNRGGDPGSRYRAALIDLDRAISINPRFAEARHRRAEVLANRGIHRWRKGGDPTVDFRESLASSGEAIALNAAEAHHFSLRADTRANWAMYAGEQGEDPAEHYRLAIADYDRAVQCNRSDPDAFTCRANARGAWAEHLAGRRGDPASLWRLMLDDFAEALRLNPDYAEALWRRGYYRSVMGLWKEALDDLTRALELNPGLERKVRATIDECRAKLRGE